MIHRIAIAIVFTLLLATNAPTQATGIPVIDAAGLANAVQQFATLTEQLGQLQEAVATAREQLDTLKEQAETMKGLYDDLSGITGHGRMLPNAVAALHSFIPQELLDIADMGGQAAQLAAQLRQMKEEFSAASLFSRPEVARQKAQYEKAGDFVFGYAAQAKALFDGFAGRRGQLESLGNAATTATTPKATLDLIAKATAENTLLLNDIAQMLALDLKARMDGEILRHNAEALKVAPKSTTADVQY